MKLPKNLGQNKMTYKLVHQTCLGVATTLIRFSDSTGITDLRELRDFIANLSPEEFAKFKFKDSDPVSIDAEFDDSDLTDSEVFE